MSKKKTHEEYVAELAIKNPTVEVVEQYIDFKTKILHHCLIHDIYWKMSPDCGLRGVKCSECKKESLHKLHCRTHEDYVFELKEKNPTVEATEKYIDARTPIMHHCLIHDIYWKASPDNILHGQGCKQCGIEKYSSAQRRTQEQYVFEVNQISPHIIVVGTYINASTPILHKCTIHDIEWMAYPCVILKGGCCNECRKEKVGDAHRKHEEQYVCELKLKNPDVILIGEYVNANTPALHKCLIDGHEWMAAPANILYGYGCPRCNESSGERQIRQWLEEQHIDYKFQKTFKDCRDIKLLPFDFYLLDYNACIEYQGKQHYEAIDFFGGEEQLKIQQYRDNIKREYCKNNNIRLLEIPYYKNIEETLNNFLFI